MVSPFQPRRDSAILERAPRRYERCRPATALDRAQRPIFAIPGELSCADVRQTGYYWPGPGPGLSRRSQKQRRYSKPGSLRHRISRKLESLARVRVVFRPPGLPAFAQRIMQVRFVDVTETSLDSAFLLAMATVDERRASTAQNSKLPFRKRVAAPKPARSEHHFPTTIKTRYRI